MSASKNPYELSDEFQILIGEIKDKLKDDYAGELSVGYSCPVCVPKGYFIQNKRPRVLWGFETPFSKEELVLFVEEAFIHTSNNDKTIQVLFCDKKVKSLTKTYIKKFADDNGYKVSWLKSNLQ